MKLQVASHDCAFVGDDPRWDLIGPKAVGIASIIINREGTVQQVRDAQMINSLHRLVDKLTFL